MTLFQVNPELDDAIGVLKSYHRREILYHLEDTEADVVQLDELVDVMLAGDPHATDREAVTTNLHHTHLPQLDDIGWIEYDFRSKTVRYRPETVPTGMLTFFRTQESPPPHEEAGT